jgi:hypothetical protein
VARPALPVRIHATAQNVTNRTNYIGYSGVLISPFVSEPTNVLNPREVEIGARFGFDRICRSLNFCTIDGVTPTRSVSYFV